MPAELKIFVGASALSALATWITILLAHRYDWVARPREDRWNQRTVAKYGGVAILLSLCATAGVLRFHLHFGGLSPNAVVLVGLTAAMALVGLIDDLFVLRPAYKLAAQITVGVVALANGIVYHTNLPGIVSFAFTLLWILIITNALNLLDNMDGLSAGIGCIASIVLFTMVRGSSEGLGLLLLGMAGSLLGFLLFNFNPAKIFMGDTGSLAIGFFLACSTVMGASHLSSLFSVLFVPALVLFIPIFDILLVSITRRMRGRAISAGAKDHSSHRLVMLGLSERQAVLTLYAISAAAGAIAVVGKTQFSQYSNGFLASFFVFGVLFWLYLAKLQVPEQWLSRSNVLALVIPQLISSLAQRAGMVFMDSILIVLSMYFAFALRFDGLGAHLSSFLMSCALAVAVKVTLLALYSCYRRQWEIRSLGNLYPILKASCVAAAMMVVILTYVNRLQDFSRTVFVVDALFTVALLSIARISHRLFDDMLPRSRRRNCLVIGSPRVEIACRYLEWTGPDREIIAILSDETISIPDGMRVPIRPVSTLENLLEIEAIEAVFIPPQCSPQVVQDALVICSERRVPLIRVEFSEVEILSSAAPSNPEKPVVVM